jgi:tetratricopeptide (TPR) repeat protein
MSNNNQSDPTKHFAVCFLPWLLGLAMFVVYAVTLNRWVTLANLLPVSKVSGFIWQPDLHNPLLFLATLPFRWLPVAQVPLALNVFSALCAAVTLGLLARCVAILPHDRTEMERSRERSDFGFLTKGGAWFPPLLAVAMFGLQFSFWHHATSFTGEMLDLMIFAIIIWLLLEYRLDEREGRLTLAALIYGAGMTNNWALIGFLPVFVAAIIWLKGLEFFNLRFLGRMSLAGLAGMMFFLLLPLMGKISGDYPLSFWEMLKPALKLDWQVIMLIKVGEVRHNLLLMSVTTFLPVLVMAIRWSSNFGDSSRIGTMLANYMFHVIHAVVFGVCVWVMFDPPFSAGRLSGISPALTFYYLSALALGYFAGYYLLVFGSKAVPTRRNPKPLPALPGQLNVLSPVVYWGTFAIAGITLGALLYKNLPLIRSQNDSTLLHYAQLTEQSLPAGGGVLLSDPESVTSSRQARTLLVQAVLARSGRSKDFLVVDTELINYAPYHRYLHKQSPLKWPLSIDEKNMGGVHPFALLNTLNNLVTSNTVCYLNPSYGYFFELFYLEPHGLAYHLKKLPEVNLLPPPPATNLIAENQQFWKRVAEIEFPRIEKALAPAQPATSLKFFDWVVTKLHGKSEPNPNTLLAANLYSRSLNHWGVELQRAGHLTAAAECFSGAQKINPDNIVASYNLEFNQTLQAGTPFNIDPSRANVDQFGKYRNWNAILNANGPFDEPSFVFANAAMLAQSGYQREAIVQFARVRQLAPDNLTVRLMLAQLYLMNRLPDPAIEALEDPHRHPARFGLNTTNSTELNVLLASAYFQKNETAKGLELLEREISRHPDDTFLLTTATQALFMRGLYANALAVIERQLDRTPDDPQWLFGKAYAHLQMTNYPQAITTFSRVLTITTNDPGARFNRALACMQDNRLNEARADYLVLQTAYTNSHQVAYGLGEVAWRQHQTNEAIRNFQIFLDNAPTNSVEIPDIRERLKSLKR